MDMKPVLVEIYGIPIKAYGFFLALAFLVGTIVASKEAERRGIDGERVIDLALISVITSLIGARLLFVLLEWERYTGNLAGILQVTEGGLSFHGGLLAAVLAGIIYCRRRGISPWKMADIVAPVVALGTAITRIGCLLNGCCFGYVSQVPWALQCSEMDAFYRHPTQLYAAILNFALFVYLWRRRDHRRFDGYLGLVYLMGYSAMRFIVEIWRESEYLVPPLKVAQAASLIIFAATLVAVRVFSQKKRAKPS